MINLLIVLFDKSRVPCKYVLQKKLVLYCITLCAVQALSTYHIIIEL
jgi:hypothetical protein